MLAAGVVSGQKTFTFGPKVGINIADLYASSAENTRDLNGTKPSLIVGAFAEYRALKWLAVSADVLYSRQGSTDKATWTERGPGGGFVTESEEFSYRLNYLNIPILANFYVNKDNKLAWRDPDTKLREGDKVNQDYLSKILWMGAFAQLEYNREHYKAFVSTSVTSHSYKREDPGKYGAYGNQETYPVANVKTPWSNFVPFSVKAGFNYRFNGMHNVFVNGGYVTKAPMMDNIFVDNTPLSNPIPEKIATGEIGYGFNYRTLSVMLNGYYTQWMDKSVTKAIGSWNGPRACIPNIDARHMGIELEASYQPLEWLRVYGFCTCLQDSLPALAAPARDQWARFTSSQTYRMTYVAVPLIAAGLIVAGEDSHFHSLRDNFLPSFRHHYDDYLQYAPAIAMLGLKIGGIQGRSSWGRMLVSDAFSASLMAIAVNTLKHTVKVMRPDGSNRHSFPSGHSATAFMTATMLHKEYGMTRSPWYSIGAYTAATLTGLSRQMNNKHWLSDVLVGAGIGILSTEVGYYLADLIFKGRGITYARLPDRPFDPGYKPSFFGLYLGLNLTPGRYALEDGREVSLSTGGTAGVEGAWFITRHIGIGGRATISNMPLSVDKILQDESLDMISGYVGPFFSYPLTCRWLVGGKLLAGYVHYPSCRLSDIRIGDKNGFGFGTGLSVTFLANHKFGMKFSTDYDLVTSGFVPRGGIRHVLTLCGGASIMF